MRYANGELMLPMHVPVSTPAAPVPPPQTYCAVNTIIQGFVSHQISAQDTSGHSAEERLDGVCLPGRQLRPPSSDRGERGGKPFGARVAAAGELSPQLELVRGGLHGAGVVLVEVPPYRTAGEPAVTRPSTTFKRAIQLGSTVSGRLATYRECVEIDRTRET